jgi:hypothetical protein
VIMRFIERYNKESPTWGRLATNATMRVPRALNFADVNGTIAVEAVPHCEISGDATAAATRAAMLRDNETILIPLDVILCNASQREVKV